MATLWRWCGLLGLGLVAGAAWAVEGAAKSTAAPAARAALSPPSALSPSSLLQAPLALPLRRPVEAPVIAVLALNEGTETTDFLVPHAVLQRARVGTVEAVAPRAGPVVLMPALEVTGARDMASFDAAHPAGADIVIVPAMHVDDDPAVIAWLRLQAAKGAVVVGICSGARVLGQAGLLDGRRFTGHWHDRGTLLRRHPGSTFVPDRRYAADGPVITTTGVSASLPASLALVEALAGTARARALADELGVVSWGPEHHSERFGLDGVHLRTLVANTVMFWRHERIAIPVADGVDDVALAFSADAWSRTYRSRADAVNPQAATVRLRSGLVVRASHPPASAAQRMPLADVRPGCQLEHSLHAIGRRHGDATRRWVATQLEYGVGEMLPSQEAPAGACGAASDEGPVARPPP